MENRHDCETPLQKLVSGYLKVFMRLCETPMEQRHSLAIKMPKQQHVLALCQEMTRVFVKEPVLLELTGQINIIGDLHGHLPDLARIMRTNGLPPEQKYLFLGDLVDRGEFSFETVLFIFILKLQYPNCIYSIRGNHEFASLCSNFGFLDQVMQIYQSPVPFNAITDVFNYMPLAAIINGQAFCVHGGIGPQLTNISQFKSVIRPLDELYGGIANSILWSDPCPSVVDYRPSERGSGFKFGQEAIDSFLQTNNLKYLIRGHSYIVGGVEMNLNNKVITVFSASNYCGNNDNKSGMLRIKEDGSYEPLIFDPLPHIVRRQEKGIVIKTTNAENGFFVKADQSRFKSAPSGPCSPVRIKASVAKANNLGFIKTLK